MELDHVGLRRADQRNERIDLEHRLVVGRDLRVELTQFGDAQRSRVALEHEAAGEAGGRAHQRHRPRREMRQDQPGAVEVVLDDVELVDRIEFKFDFCDLLSYGFFAPNKLSRL